MGADFVELAFEAMDAVANEAAVGFDLGFAGAACADAAAEALEVGPLAGEAGEEVFVLGELDLEAALLGAGAAGEDVYDEGGAVNDLGVDDAFDDLLLGGGKLIIQDDDGGVAFGGEVANLFELAFTEVGRRGTVEALADDGGDGGAGGAGKLG